MRKKIVYMLICLLLSTSVVGAITAPNAISENKENEPVNTAYHNNALVEYGTYTTCTYCKYGHEALIYLFKRGNLPFYYVVHIYDVNTHAYGRVKTELGLTVSPTAYWDAGWRTDVGSPSNATAQADYKKSIFKCENRTVKNIDLDLDVKWLGAVNNHPEDGETKVPIERILNWTSTEMIVNVSVKNNEASQYNGHLHVYVCDVKSSMDWYDTADRLYSMAFLDYAFNENLALGAGSTWEGSKKWDGTNHTNGSHFFNYVTQDNTMVVASIFDRDNEDYSDETTGVRVGLNTDPKSYTIYMGNTTPPPLVINNISVKYFFNETLDWNTTYYWRVDEWNQNGERIVGDIWSFTTRDNHKPAEPSSPNPSNNSFGRPINTNLSWVCEDPNGDDVLFSVWFGEYETGNLILVSENQTGTTYVPPQNLKFGTRYFWKIVAWDEYDLVSKGPIWYFDTEDNFPPEVPSDPHPENGENSVPVDVILNWTGEDPNLGDVLTFDVFFATSNPPHIKVSANQSENFFDPSGDLELYETYYWRIVSWDSGGLYTVGPVWRFTTGLNLAPDDPSIDGPDQGQTGDEIEFEFVTTDPEGQDIFYKVDWGDGDVTEWDGSYESGTKITLSHTWDEKDNFIIRCKAKDIYDEESEWSEFEYKSPKSKYSPTTFLYFFVKSLLQHLPLLNQIFTLFPAFNNIINLQ